MELRDLIVTPIWLFIIYGVAYWVRPRFTDENTKKYFIPALTVRIIGAISVGLIYQFYYSGGDTFTYHTRGSAVIWQAFVDNPINGFKLLFAGKERILELHEYTKQMWFYGDLSSYFVIRIAAFFDLFTFRSYAATAVLFAFLSFTGIWALYLTFHSYFKHLHKPLALAILFVPSVFFWGSGILKDTLTLAALGWATYAFDQFIFKRQKMGFNLLMFLMAAFILFSVKKYILLCLAPALIGWVYFYYMAQVKSVVLKVIITPFVLIITLLLGYFSITQVGAGDSRYALENIAETARVTAYDIRYGWGARTGEGSGYTLGELDGTVGSMVRLFPTAVNVSLFRPYLWEVKNPLMLLAALESMLVLFLTLGMLYKTRITGLFKKGTDPVVLFCFIFSIVFAFAVGVSTYNFGTLMRYKIPLMPFYLSAMVILRYSKKDKKLVSLEATE